MKLDSIFWLAAPISQIADVFADTVGRPTHATTTPSHTPTHATRDCVDVINLH